MKLQPYWLDSAPAFAAGAEEPLPAKCDVAIVGGGFTGLSAALAFARQGIDVVVLEAGSVAAAASGRNGGHCNNGLAHDFTATAARLGLEKASALYRAYDSAVDTVESVAREESIDCDFRRSGKIQLASKPRHFERLQKTHEILSHGIDTQTRLIPRAEIGREVKSTSFHGGLLYERSASLHVGCFGIGLAEAAARRGARIFERRAITGLARLAGSRFELHSNRDGIRAERVLVATGANTPGIFPFLHRRIVPVGSFIVATEPLSLDAIDSIMPGRRTAVTTKHVGNYFRISPDNRLIFGGRARFAMSNPESDAKSGQVLARMLRQVFPQLKGVGIDYCWGGLIDMTTDRLPRAGQKDGLFYSMGYSGHGVQMSVHMGQIMADVMAGDAEANPWRGLDWPAVPGHFGTPWFLPLVGAYYRLLDRIH